MKNLIDVVNFNGDASCLPSKKWLKILEGGKESEFIAWLQLFVDFEKSVVLGFPGATVVDIAIHNPEAIDYINSNTDIFEIILRPFSHDIALLRTEEGFKVNYAFGHKVITTEFQNISPYFLPPEFMLTNSQLFRLYENKVSGVFINPERFPKQTKSRIPSYPYKVKSLFGKSINCIPFRGDLTGDYLDALQKFNCDGWNNKILSSENEMVFTWRDGESLLFLPNGLEREAFWLKNENAGIRRKHIKDVKLEFISNDSLAEDCYKSYPVHSFSAWMKEFRMLGFINKINRIEDSLQTLTGLPKHLWLMVINSDILSAIEKKEPTVQIRQKPESPGLDHWTIQRSERGFEGEEYLAVLKSELHNERSSEYIFLSQEPHMIKLRRRIEYLSNLDVFGNSTELERENKDTSVLSIQKKG